jgi:hypothetical protein
MSHAALAHSLVAAHADRIEQFARLYGVLASEVAAHGTESDEAHGAHRRLGARIVEWETTDQQAERADIVVLSTEDRQALVRDTARAINAAERQAHGLPERAREHEVVRSLRKFHSHFPAELPRASLVRLRRSAKRAANIEKLGGPGFLLGSEAEVLLGALESATAPIAPPEVEFDSENGFHATLAWGLEACLVRDPGAVGVANLGLGVSPSVIGLLGLAGEKLDAEYDQWLRLASPSHPFGRYPFVPSGRLGDGTAERRVRGDLDSTGPIGWATPAEAATLAQSLSGATNEHGDLASELQRSSARIQSTAARGQAVIGWIEYLPPEAEGQPKWFVELEADRG